VGDCVLFELGWVSAFLKLLEEVPHVCDSDPGVSGFDAVYIDQLLSRVVPLGVTWDIEWIDLLQVLPSLLTVVEVAQLDLLDVESRSFQCLQSIHPRPGVAEKV